MAWVYLMSDLENENVYKIGMTRSNNINKRKKELQTGNPNLIFIDNAFETDFPFKIEKMLHNKYSYKQKLNEWYELDKQDVDNFKQTCQDFENICIALKDNPFF
jgi:hypothetical protein